MIAKVKQGRMEGLDLLNVFPVSVLSVCIFFNREREMLIE